MGWFGAQTEALKILAFCLQKRLHDLSVMYFEVCCSKEMQEKKISKKLNSIKLLCKIFKSIAYPCGASYDRAVQNIALR